MLALRAAQVSGKDERDWLTHWLVTKMFKVAKLSESGSGARREGNGSGCGRWGKGRGTAASDCSYGIIS